MVKLTTLCLLVGLLHVSAAGVSQVTYRANNEKLERVFAEIKKQTGFLFFYRGEHLAQAKPVTVVLDNAPLITALSEVMKDQPLTYSIEGNTVFIAPRPKQALPPTVSIEEQPALPPPNDITGRVVDAEGNPLMGASVMVKGTKTGTQTNAEGFYSIKGIDENASLEISYVGHATVSIPVQGRKAVNVQLQRSVNPLDEIQIEAYSRNTKRLSTGNVTSVKSEEIERQPVQNPLLALQGRVPGLVVTQTTGMANGNVRIRIQGQNSLNDSRNEPLIVIDDVPYPTTLPDEGRSGGPNSPISGNDNSKAASPLSFINPNDIESISVLKDAEATAIYGSRGANGVVLITTKKGKAGKEKIDVRLQHGMGMVTRRLNMMNTRQYLDMRYEAYVNDGIDWKQPSYTTNVNDLKVWDTTRYTDWQKTLIGETAQYTNVGATVSGGNSNFQHLIGGTYSRVTDVMPGDFANVSGSIHFNLSSSSSNQRFKISLTGSYLSNNSQLPGLDLTERALFLEPNAPALFNPDGTLNWAPNAAGTSTWQNPLSYLSQKLDYSTQNLVSNLQLSYAILPGLTIKSSFGLTDLRSSTDRKVPLEFNKPETRPTSQRTAFISEGRNKSWIIEPQLTYAFSVSRLNINLLAGGTLQQNDTKYANTRGSGFSSDLLMGNMAAATTVAGFSRATMYRYNALFGRASLNYTNKYLLNLSIRRDGSSRFGDANKFHNFGSIGAGWIFSETEFVKNKMPFLSFGKLRGSFGTTGNDGIGDYTYLSLFGSIPTNIPYQGVLGLQPESLPNPHLQWEEVKKWSWGLDLGFLRDRILLNASYNLNRCSNQLQSYNLPSITGFTSMLQNFPALVQNTSWEFGLTTTNIKQRDLTWNSSVNLTVPRNILLEYPGIENTSYASGNSGIIVGQPIGIMKVYRYAGIDPATGVHMAFDANGNPTATPSQTADKTILLSLLPKFYGGFRNSILYKDFQLDFLFQFTSQLGLTTQDHSGRVTNPGRFTEMSNQPVSVLEGRWRAIHDQATKARFSATASARLTNLSESQAGFTTDASYIRLKNLSLAWNVPEKWIRRSGLRNASVSFQGQNLWTITGYDGVDPETASNTILPPLQMWTFCIQLGF